MCDAETPSPIAAATATLKVTSAAASLIRLSPSRMLTSRRGAPTRRMIAVAAAGSVGETIAPSAKDTAQGRSITSWAATPTTAAVASVNPIELRAITRVSSRSARRS